MVIGTIASKYKQAGPRRLIYITKQDALVEVCNIDWYEDKIAKSGPRGDLVS
jgi:hypothetical protein